MQCAKNFTVISGVNIMDNLECFTKDEQNFPIEWFENRMEFVVRWKSSFEYKERLKR